MIFSTTDLEKAKDQLSARIDALCLEEPFLSMGHMAISQVLVSSAFACCDFNGGIDDSLHAAKRLHEMVNMVKSKRLPVS
jgi:hypothetical protein